MVLDAISAHVQDVHDDLRKLASRLLDLPNAKSVKYVEGATTSVAGEFTNELKEVAESASEATRVVIEELNKTDSATRAALADLAAQDDQHAIDLRRGDALVRGAGEAVNAPSRGSYGPDGTSA